MHAPRKHYFINISAPNHLLQPLLLRTKMSVHQIQQVLQDRHQQMLSLAAEVMSMNSAFTFTASFPAWLLKLPIASKLSCDETAKLFKESSKNELLQLTVRTPTDSLRFSLVKPNTMYSHQVCQETHGTAMYWGGEGGTGDIFWALSITTPH